ncbi:hypothetical protein BELL_0657g00020 [Botrytis elliptica]|uniref:BTB domain-containing protein n=1 Tax=Botrytis elliptica TaxID=278938 RepID=A0A4Z1JHR7_9HELO|nr:hypothetical protein EAE99_008335 [Botrytis elliptica]TGO70842.1 hypothetical protein BELL_0657g00020 [Botrytis elliptica]
MTSKVTLNLKAFCKVFTIVIGRNMPDRTTMVKVSVPLLAAQSFYFKTASSQPWIGGESTIEFPDVSCSTFEIFMVWLNTGHIKNAGTLRHNVGPDHWPRKPLTEQLSEDWDQLISCYLMADYIQAPRYTNHIMNALIETLKKFEWVPVDDDFPLEPLCNSCIKTVNIVWTETVATSPLRNLILDTLGLTHHAPQNMTETLFLASPAPETLGDSLTVPEDFLKSLQLHTQVQAPWGAPKSAYHIEEKLPRPN